MAGREDGRSYACVLVDLNTQHDFCVPTGVAPVLNGEPLIEALTRLFTWAQQYRVPVISSEESHRPIDLCENGHPGYCMDGTPGQCKLDMTLLRRHVHIEVDNTLCCPLDVLKSNQQVIFRKRSDDLLANPKADRLFSQLSAKEFLLFGVSAEGSIKALGLGLRARGKRVTVIQDACGYWDAGSADLALRQLEAKGAELTTVEEVVSRTLPRRRRRYRTRLARVVRKAVRSKRLARQSSPQVADPGVLPEATPGATISKPGRNGRRRKD